MKPIFSRNGKISDNIVDLLSEKLTLDSSVFKDVLKFGFVLGEKTPFKEIKREHKIILNKKEEIVDENEIKKLFLDFLKDSILNCVGNESEIGLFFSGGIDSGTLAIVLGNYFKDLKVHAFTASFSGNKDEVKNAIEIAKKYKFTLHLVEVSEKDFDFWEEAIKAIGMPISDEASIPLFKLSQKAKEIGVKKLLMGDGNDELWLGYDNYYLLKKIKERLPFNLKKFGSFLEKTNIPRIRGIGKLLQIPGNWQEAVRRANDFDLFEAVPYCWIEQRYGIARYFGLEAKFPYLSQSLIDLSQSVPIFLKMKKSNKWIIKEAIAKIDPIILKRKKRMMGFPNQKLFKKNKEKVKKIIESCPFLKYNIFDGYYLTLRKFVVALWYKIFVLDFQKWKKIKVVFFIPTLEIGGAERRALRIAKSLDKKKYDCKFLVGAFKGGLVKEIPKDLNVENLKAPRVRYFLFKLINFFKKEKFNIFISFLPHANINSILAKKFSKSKSKIIVCEAAHFTLTHKIAKNLKNKLITLFILYPLVKIIYPLADLIICNSQGSAKDLEKFLGKKGKIKVIYNPLPIEEISQLMKEPVEDPWFLDKKVPIILSVGRLSKQKDHSTLLNAFKLVLKEREARLVIVGDGEERKKIENLIKKLNVYEKVKLLGFQLNPFKFMSRSTIFVLSSIVEGFPNVILEAMACGLPVISTNCPSGPNEIIKDGENGFLIPVRDEKSLARAILKLLNDEKLREKFSIEGKKTIQNFSKEKIIKEWEKLFEELL